MLGEDKILDFFRMGMTENDDILEHLLENPHKVKPLMMANIEVLTSHLMLFLLGFYIAQYITGNAIVPSS